MPRKADELGALQIAQIAGPGLHAVGGVAGLALQVEPSGARSWVLRARIAGKRRMMGLGGYPDVKLADARRLAREAREAIDRGQDPIEDRKAAKARLLAEAGRLLTFEAAAKDYIATHEASWKNQAHRQAWRHTLLTLACEGRDYGEAGQSVGIGKLAVGDITVEHALALLRPIWSTTTETGVRTRQRVEQVLNAAKAAGAIRTQGWSNPFAWKGHLDKLLPPPQKVAPLEHHPALPPQEAPSFMAALRQREGLSAKALELIILTGGRSGEIRGAVWDEFDLVAKVWTVPGARMKAGQEHVVPLSEAALKVLGAIPRIAGTHLLFPGATGNQLSDVAVSKLCKSLCKELGGGKCVPHGWRSTFRDWVGDFTHYPDKLAEFAVAHTVGGTEGAYRRRRAIERRRPMMADWARFLAEPFKAQEEGNVLELHAARD
jgi:integrase